jgi:hypothetical protein
VQQVGVKFYIYDRAARKMYNIKLVYFLYLLISLMLHVKHHKKVVQIYASVYYKTRVFGHNNCMAYECVCGYVMYIIYPRALDRFVQKL